MNSPEWTILHLTDLHVHNPGSDTELFRSGKYREYLANLAEEIRSHVARVDLVAVTGDFVHRGSTQYLAHVDTVLSFFLEQLGLGADRLVGCIGNHDLIKEREVDGEWLSARSDVQKFLNKYANGTCRRGSTDGDGAVLCEIEPGLWCLSLDSLWGSVPPHRPGPGLIAPGRGTDAIMQLVYDVPLDAALIVLSHYPVDPQVGVVAAWEDEDPSWFERHLWSAATPIKERLRRYRKGATLWLCGDIHRDGDRVDGSIHHITTGRIGTDTGSGDSALSRQAKVIVVNGAPNNGNRILRLRYSTDGHKSQSEYGDWKGAWDEEDKAASPGATTDIPETQRVVTSVVEIQGGEAVASTKYEVSFEILDPVIEEVIVSTIRDYDMYLWGRFSTSDEEVLLSWIPVGPLLNAGRLFGSIVKAMSRWLVGRLDVESTERHECLLLGMDCWGAALASQVSVVVGCPNVCIGTRGRGEHHAPGEGFDRDVYERLRASKVVVFVTDSVSTGRTLRWTYEQIRSGLSPDESDGILWLCLTVLRDPLQPPACDLSFISAEGLACGALRRPFLPADRVPDDGLMPSQISFNR